MRPFYDRPRSCVPLARCAGEIIGQIKAAHKITDEVRGRDSSQCCARYLEPGAESDSHKFNLCGYAEGVAVGTVSGRAHGHVAAEPLYLISKAAASAAVPSMLMSTR